MMSVNEVVTDSCISWEKANLRYLTLALAHIHHSLDCYIADRNNKEVEPISPEVFDLDRVASAMSRPPAIETLSKVFNLSLFERQVLLLCVARAIHPNFPALCALASNNAETNYPTFQLALELFPHAHWDAFSPHATLRHWQLVRLSPGEDTIHTRLQVNESILHYLLGESYQDPQLLGIVRPMFDQSRDIQSSQEAIAQEIAKILSSSSGLTTVQLCGPEIEEKWRIAAKACEILQLPLHILAVLHLPTEPTALQHFIFQWQRFCRLSPTVLLLDCEEIHLSDPVRQATILDFIHSVKTPIIVSNAERFYSPRQSLMAFDVDKLSYYEQLNLWKQHLGETAIALNGHVEAIASQFNLSSSLIQAACLSIQPETKNTIVTTVTTAQVQQKLWRFCRLQARPSLDDLAQRIDCTATWDDLVLPEKEKLILSYISTYVQQRAKVYQEWGFAGKSGRGLSISALFSGPSGTGKTMAAEVLAQEFSLDLYRIDLSAVVSKYIGETEKNLRRIFDAAETGGAVLLFDEADALFGKRSQVQSSHDRHANIEVSYLLQRMEAYQGLAILTTNLKDSLDQAFIRRIRFMIAFPFPDATARAEIWQRVFPSKTPTQDLDYKKLSKLNVAGGNIRNIALGAAFFAADRGEPVMMKHILQAAQSEYMKLGKSLTNTETEGWTQ